MLAHLIYIVFAFAFGACIGSFLNVVVWRLPRGESLVHPPSRCPKCSTPLAWYDNVPVLGWLMLGGKCRYCRVGISPRYPIVEAAVGLLFVFYYVMFFLLDIGPWPPMATWTFDPFTGRTVSIPGLLVERDWPTYLAVVIMVSCLVAATLIDAEHYIIPLEITWVMAVAGVVINTLWAMPDRAGMVYVTSTGVAMALGGGVGLLISLALLWTGLLRRSFTEVVTVLEVDKQKIAEDLAAGRITAEEAAIPPAPTREQLRTEMGREMTFLIPPVALSGAALALGITMPMVGDWFSALADNRYATGFLGAVLGFLVGGFVVWMVRILGSLAFGREAMGLGDVHLMAAVGAVLGAGPATVAFFLAPLAGVAWAIYLMLTGKRREVPFGPYLSAASAAVVFCYGPISEYLRPGIEGALYMIRGG